MRISQYLPVIVNLIEHHPIVSVEAATGSGKSVGIPAAEAAIGRRCFVVVPTRTAALSLAEYQRVLQQAINPIVDVQRLVGSAAEGEIRYTSETMIAYVTGGHARIKMLSYFVNGAVKPTGIDFCDVLMVDEVHSGSIDNTVVISLWLAAHKANVRVPRLVIASATPVPLTITPKPYDFPIVIESLPIEVRYLSKEAAKNYLIDDPAGALYMDAAQLAFTTHQDTPIDSGHILIFAPGSAEVETIASALTDLLTTTPIPGKTAIVIPAFSALQREDINLIYKPTTPTERKIVIATNIAEMSITIEDIGHVIDTMAERRAETSKNGGPRLITHYISKDSANQRKGRTGRTRPGTCYRLCTEELFDRLEQHRPPEIERVPIYRTVIELLDVGLVPEQVLIGVTPARVMDAVNLLTKLGMTTVVNGKREVTASGHFAPNFPLSVRNAAFLWKWINYNGLHFNSKIIEQGMTQGLDLNYFEIDASSEYSSLLPSQMPSVNAIYQQLQLHPRSIIDATANVGGDTIHFARLFPEAAITAIELDPSIALILRRNIESIPSIIGRARTPNIRAVNMSAVEYFRTDRFADLIYFDPPWGGRDYHLQPSLNLTLDGIPIGTIIDEIFRRGMTSLVALKLPVNANMQGIVSDISLPVNAQPYNVTADGQVAYALLFIQPNPLLPLLDPSVMNVNLPPEVALVPANRPIFTGIVTAALIDSYGPSYFYIPRKKPGQSDEEYHLMLRPYKEKHFAKYVGYSDLETALKMWDELIHLLGGYRGTYRQILGWTRENSLNNKKIRELLKTVEQCVKSATRMGYPVQVGLAAPERVVNAARPLLRSVYADVTLIHTQNIQYYSPSTRESFRLDTRDSLNRLAIDPPLGVIALITSEFKGKGRVTRRISFALDTDKDGLDRPIKRRELEETRRGPRVITHSRTQPTTSPANLTMITDTLNLFKTMSLGTTTAPDLEPILRPWISNQDYASVPFAAIQSYSAATITQNFLRHRVQFPYRHRYRSVDEARASFVELFSYTPNWQTTPYEYYDARTMGVPLRMSFQQPGTDFNQYLWLPNDPVIYQSIDWMVDYFIEESRLQCQRKGAPIPMSPHDAWYSYGTYVETAIQRVLAARQDLSLMNVREALYQDKRVPECTHEKVTFLSSLMKILNLNMPRVFDGSAGWGDRMIASMTLGASYYLGIDPNTNTQPGFTRMVDVLGSMILPNEPKAVISHRFGVLPLSMPDAVLPTDATEGSFDVAFLSPPSFDSELYSQDQGQSTVRWANEKVWYFHFLFPTIDRCWAMVRPGGYFIVQSILIRNIAPYIEYKFPDAFFCGPIAVEVSKRKKPLWIWYKVDPTTLPESQQEESNALKQRSTTYITSVFPELITGIPPEITSESIYDAFDILKTLPTGVTPATTEQIIIPPTVAPPTILSATEPLSVMPTSEQGGLMDLLNELDFGETTPTSSVPVAPISFDTLPLAPISPATLPLAPISFETLPVAPISPATLPVAPISFETLPLAPISLDTLPVAPISPGTLPLAPISPTTLPVAPISPGTLPVAPVSFGTLPVAPISPGTLPMGAISTEQQAAAASLLDELDFSL